MAVRAHRVKFIDRLFVLMHVSYGHLWSSRFPTEAMLRTAKAQWALSLHPWSERQVEQAMDRCRRVYEGPPTLPQFMNLMRTETFHKTYRALPRPPCDKEKAMAAIRAMRDVLGRAS